MEKFISRIIDEIDATDFDQLRKRCYIFPTKRGGLYFESFLKNKYSDKVFWAPKVLSIKEFVEFMVGRKITDSMTLLFELFDVYKVMDPEGNLETFEKFYPWGEILLKDFDEIDKYLVDAEKLFQNIYDIKEMEARFGMEDPAIEAINKFRSIISGQDKTELLKKFLTVWKMVGKIYQSFKQNLSDKKMAFEGMLYKELLNLFTTQTDKSNYTEFHFCGFNALSNAEEAIFDVLLKQKRATLYWDADPVYMDTRYWHEAGWFLKKYKQKWEDNENCKWFYCNMLKEQKNIQIIGAVQNMAQVKITSELLKQNFTEANIEKADTAIVLANEQLLIPALYALPKNVKETNVTMGYPAFQSSISTLLQKILDLQIIRSGKGDKSYFRSEELIAVLKNSNIQILCKKNLGEINHWILNNRRNFISLADIKEKVKNELTLSIFEPKKKASEMMHFLVSFSRNLFQAFHRNYKNKKEQNIEDPELKNELDFLYNFIEHLSAFGGRIERNLNRLNLSLLRKMLTESLRSLKVPFNGDSLRGLQVMGFLETRTLDFENLYLLSANETHLPAERKLNSFVPYSVRKAFQMPTFEEQDAIYSYHFYRLLQRAKNVYLLYDTEPKSGLNVGEQSRFLKQLLRLVKDERNQSAINISEIKYDNTAPKEQKAKEIISIEKTPEVLDKMNIYLLNNNGNVSGEETKSFSPTSLSNYIECSLRFYFNYIAGIRPLEDRSFNIEASDLGNLVHETLEELYKKFIGKQVEKEALKSNKEEKKINKILESLLKKHFFIKESMTELNGRNRVNLNIAKQIIQSVIERDMEDTPFILHSVESNSKRLPLDIGAERQVALGGIIDRVDEMIKTHPGVKRIVDYKTGRVVINKSKKLEMDEYIESYFEKGELKAGFQAYFYALLYHKTYPSQSIMAGIYDLKKVFNGVNLLNSKEEIPREFFEMFESRLKQLFNEMFDPTVPFQQTENQDHCLYCKYNQICHLD